VVAVAVAVEALYLILAAVVMMEEALGCPHLVTVAGHLS
jgi:hypothetical protein